MVLVFRFVKLAAHFYFFYLKQRRFAQKLYAEIILPVCARIGEEPNQKMRKKMEHYYGVGIPYLLHYYKILYGKELEHHELVNATSMGFSVPVLDDLTDLQLADENTILYAGQVDELPPTASMHLVLYHTLYNYLLKRVPNPELFKQQLDDLLRAQFASVVQLNPEKKSFENLLQISLTKGGESFLLFHCMLDESMSPELGRALFKIGGLHQLANDHFDVHKDLVEEGIYTASNTCSNYRAFFDWYCNETKGIIEEFRKLPVKNKETFLFFAIGVIARGLVALNQLKELEVRYGAPMDLKKLSRKELITDMEKPKNILLTLRYLYRLLK